MLSFLAMRFKRADWFEEIPPDGRLGVVPPGERPPPVFEVFGWLEPKEEDDDEELLKVHETEMQHNDEDLTSISKQVAFCKHSRQQSVDRSRRGSRKPPTVDEAGYATSSHIHIQGRSPVRKRPTVRSHRIVRIGPDRHDTIGSAFGVKSTSPPHMDAIMAAVASQGGVTVGPQVTQEDLLADLEDDCEVFVHHHVYNSAGQLVATSLAGAELDEGILDEASISHLPRKWAPMRPL